MRSAWKVRLAGWPPVRCEAGGDGVAQQLDQPGRGGERLLLALADDRPRRSGRRSAPRRTSRRIRARSPWRVGVEHLGRGDARSSGPSACPAARRGGRRSRARPRRAAARRRRGRTGRRARCPRPARRAPRRCRRRRRGRRRSRSPKRASRSPDSARASSSRSRPISRAAGQRSRIASAWPPMPERARRRSTAPGACSAGASSSTMRSRSTGTCRAAASPRLLIVSSGRGGGGAVGPCGVRSASGCGPTRRLVPIRSGPGAGEVASGGGSAGGRQSGRRSVSVVVEEAGRAASVGDGGVRAPGPPPRSTE